MLILKSEGADVDGIESDLVSVVMEVLRDQGIPTSEIVGTSYDEETVEEIFTEFPTAQ